ncbi:MAG: ABC transporter ATP-binding protein [Aigarchaeota archaeon]|nr:ABC transporter ATP-binding protein [Aigarchaeota archaeon]MDH5703680.1 ABC transporter ATP-binding protein [Aigarchaeota archaeon]
MSEYAVELQDVEKLYRLGPGVEVHALRGVNLAVSKGDFISIMGPSGSGKTTLLNIIGTMDRPTRGRVKIDGIDVTDMNEGKLADFRCGKMGYLFQFFNLISTLDAIENVKLPMILSGRYTEREADHRARDLLELVALEEAIWRNRPVQMSGGERQRVALARALANEPALIIMDEPTGALDTVTGAKVMKLAQMLNEFSGQTFIVVSHNPLVARMAKKVYYIRDGKLYENPPESLMKFEAELSYPEKRALFANQLRILKESLLMLEKRWQSREIGKDSYVATKFKIVNQLKRITEGVESSRRGVDSN